MDREVKKMITAMRRCGNGDTCEGCKFQKEIGCVERLMLAAADLFEQTAMKVPPANHGDLIDKQAVLDDIIDLAKGSRVLAGWGNLRLLYTLVNTAPTIIPAAGKQVITK